MRVNTVAVLFVILDNVRGSNLVCGGDSFLFYDWDIGKRKVK